ncbi:MAG TPA: hypothetical protein VF277_09975 [Steroidobacteraceae bacterium]
MKRLPVLLSVVLLGVGACQRHPAAREWLGPPESVEVPAAAGSRFPHLAGGSELPVVLSWLQPGAAPEFSLQLVQWSERGLGRPRAWSAPRTVATGRDWFVNWADFPSVVPVSERIWAAHWLQQKPDDVYSYDVRIAVSSNGGRRWSAPLTPHDDGTPTEHGFVTLLPAGAEHVRAVWLDGRNTPGEHDHASASGNPSGAMTLRLADLDAAGHLTGPGTELDARVCDCCQTDAVNVGDTTVVVYRDRGEREVRNIRAARVAANGTITSVDVHDDGWRIAACPVNGPAIAAEGTLVAVAWFTAPDAPRVRLAFSTDGGRTFGRPLEVASGKVAGRVDVAFIGRGRAVVSWLEEGATGAELKAQPFTTQGESGTAVTIARVGRSRASGFPQMVRASDGLVFAWTESADPSRVRTAFAPLL